MKTLSLFPVYLQALDEFATKLIQNNHYAKEDVATRRDAVSTSGSFLNFLKLKCEKQLKYAADRIL